MRRLLDVLTFGTVRRRRAMDRLARELGRLDTGAGLSAATTSQLWRGTTLTPTRTQRPRRRRRRTPSPGRTGNRIGVGVVVVLLAGAAWVVVPMVVRTPDVGPGATAAGAAPALATASASAKASAKATTDAPASRFLSEDGPKAASGSTRRLHPAVKAPAGRGGYRLLQPAQDGQPALRWDPCRPIHYVVNGKPPAGGEWLVHDAVAAVSAASGLTFVADGTTKELPSDGRASYQPKRYGDRWAPLLISWTTPSRQPDLGGSTIGIGGGRSVGVMQADGSWQAAYVSGQVALDRAQFASYLSQARRTVDRRVSPMLTATVMHELGHVLGLDHVNDPKQVMYAEGHYDVTTFGKGDRRGLAFAGSGPCIPQL